jgi:hypothetical protein
VVQAQREDEAAASQPGHLWIQHAMCLLAYEIWIVLLFSGVINV